METENEDANRIKEYLLNDFEDFVENNNFLLDALKKDTIEFSSHDIHTILVNIKTYFSANRWEYDSRLASEMSKKIFDKLSDESIVNYFNSDDFRNYLSEINVWKIDDELEEMHIKELFEKLEERKSEINIGGTEIEKTKINVALGLENISRYWNFEDEFFSAIDSDSPKKVAEMKKLFLLHGIELDTGSARNMDELVSHPNFKVALNEYYSRLNEYQRENFIKSFSENSDPYDTWQYLDYDSNEESLKKRIRVFDFIYDDNKYSYADINIQSALLYFDAIDDDEIRFKMLAGMISQEFFVEYTKTITDGKYRPLEIDLEKINIGEIRGMLEQAFPYQEVKRELLFNRLLESVNLDERLKVIEDNAESDISRYIFNSLTNDEQIHFLQGLDSDEQRAKILLSSNKTLDSLIGVIDVVEDKYLRGLVTLNFTEDYNLFEEPVEEYVNMYMEIKDELLKLPESERANYISNLQYLSNGFGFYGWKNTNDIKAGLFDYVDSHEEKMQIINSMVNYYDDIHDYVETAHQMITEYFEKTGELSEKEEETLALAFNYYSTYFTTYDSRNLNGECRYCFKDITISEKIKSDPQMLLACLIHEIGHSLSCLEYTSDLYHVGNTFEEGMADTFAERVISDYMEEHNSVAVGDSKIVYEMPLPLYSKYDQENGWVRSMLYAAEQSGNDKEAIRSFYFGDKNKWLQLCMGTEVTERFDKNISGNPRRVVLDENDLRERYNSIEGFDIYLDSAYILNNNRIRNIVTLPEKSEISDDFTNIRDVAASSHLRFGEIEAAGFSLEKEMHQIEEER